SLRQRRLDELVPVQHRHLTLPAIDSLLKFGVRLTGLSYRRVLYLDHFGIKVDLKRGCRLRKGGQPLVEDHREQHRDKSQRRDDGCYAVGTEATLARMPFGKSGANALYALDRRGRSRLGGGKKHVCHAIRTAPCSGGR